MRTKKITEKKQLVTTKQKDWIPFIISVFAVVISAASFFWSKEQFKISSRPYVWACNYEIPGPSNNVIAAPSVTAFRVYNSPVRVIKLDISIVFEGNELYYLHLKNFVRFPDEKVIWTSAIVKEGFDSLMVKIPDNLKNKIHKIVSIEYAALSGGKSYHYKMEEYFWSDINQWEPITEEAD